MTISSMILCNRPSLAKKSAGRAPNSLKVCEKLCAPTQLKSPVWLKDNLKGNHWSKEIWPPSSPDCNPFDSSMWCEFERGVYKQPHKTLASLRAKVLEVMANMDREFVIHSYKKFWSRIEVVVDASGDFYEIIVYEICIYTFSKIFSKIYSL